MEFGGPRKRGRHSASLNGNGSGSFKKSRSVHVGGYKVVSQMLNLGSAAGAHVPQPARNAGPPLSFPDGSSGPAGKSKMCNRINMPEGCKFGDKCHFAHNEWELGRPLVGSFEDPRGMGPIPGMMGGRMEPPPPGIGAASNFGSSVTTKISINSSLAGTIIGKSGSNSKQISRVTGVKLAIRDHDSDPNLRNIELEGTFDQIQQASSMVRELIANVKANSGPPQKQSFAPGGGSNFKTKLCENFMKGSCTFGDRCHFAHGSEELRKSAA